MLTYEEENDLSSIVATSLRDVIEKSATDLVLPYRILALSHLSSWTTFQKDLIQILKQHSTTNIPNHQDLDLFNCYTRHFNDKSKEEDDYSFESLLNSDIDFLPVKSDFDRLHQLMFLHIKPHKQ